MAWDSAWSTWCLCSRRPGGSALPEPLLETTALAAPLLAELELPVRMGDGPAPGGLAGRHRRRDASRPSVGPRVQVGHRWPGPTVADLFVLSTPAGPGGPEIHVVESSAVTVSPVASLDPTRRLGVIGWDPAPPTRVARGALAASLIGRTVDRAAVATAAELLGLTERMIGLAAEYAKERHQFGKPIGSFQAVKHLLAGAQVKLEFARPVVYGAAWSLDQAEPTASRAASTAKAYASDAATEAARVSLQVHGAIGYTWECDLHLFLKRAWALAEAWGSAAEHRSLGAGLPARRDLPLVRRRPAPGHAATGTPPLRGPGHRPGQGRAKA